MYINNIVDILNKFLSDIRKERKLDIKGKFILTRNLEIQTIKAFKRFSYVLWYVNPKGDKKKVISYNYTVKCNQDEISKFWDEIYNNFIYDILYLIYNEREKLDRIIEDN